VCLQLAVADWSDSCLPGMDWTDNLSPEMAFDRSLCSDVRQYYHVLSEDSLFGSVAGDCLWSGILYAAL